MSAHAPSPFWPAPPSLRVTIIECTYTPVEPLTLPGFAGATFRGVLGAALRALSCITGAPTCEGCPWRDRCPYGLLWEPARGDLPQRFGTPPRAYALEVEHGDRQRPRPVEPGAPMRFRIKLFGAARGWQPQVVAAAVDAAQAGWGAARLPVEPVSIERVEPDGARTSLWSPLRGARPAPIGEGRLVTPRIEPDHGGAVVVRCRSPLVIKAGGRVLDHFDPGAFTRRLSSRLDALGAAHGEGPPEWDHPALAELAEGARVVRDETVPVAFSRFSNRMGARVPVEGVLGRVELADVAPALLALWRCAEAVHVGKNAAFGMGRVVIEAPAEITAAGSGSPG